MQVLIILPKANLVGGTAVVREAGGEEDAELIKTENLAATMEYSQTPRCLSSENVKMKILKLFTFFLL